MPRGRSSSRGRGEGRKEAGPSSASSRPRSLLADLPSDPDVASFRPTTIAHMQQKGRHHHLKPAFSPARQLPLHTSSRGTSKTCPSTRNVGYSSRSSNNGGTGTSIDYTDRVPCTFDTFSMVPATLLPEDSMESEKYRHDHDTPVSDGASLTAFIEFVEQASPSQQQHEQLGDSKKHLLDNNDDFDPIGSFTEQDPGIDQIGGHQSSSQGNQGNSGGSTSSSTQLLLRTPRKRFVVPSDIVKSPSSQRQQQQLDAASPKKRMRSAIAMSKKFTVPTSPKHSPGKQLSTPHTTSTRLRPASKVGYALHTAMNTSTITHTSVLRLAGQNVEQEDATPPRPILGDLLAIAREEKTRSMADLQEHDRESEAACSTRSSMLLSTCLRGFLVGSLSLEQEGHAKSPSDIIQSPMSMESIIFEAEPCSYATQDMAGLSVANDDDENQDEVQSLRECSPVMVAATPFSEGDETEEQEAGQQGRPHDSCSLPPTQLMARDDLLPIQMVADETPSLPPTQLIIKEEQYDNERGGVVDPSHESFPPTQLMVVGAESMEKQDKRQEENSGKGDKETGIPKERSPSPAPPSMPPPPLSLPLPSMQLSSPSAARQLSPNFFDTLSLPIPPAILRCAGRMTPLATCKTRPPLTGKYTVFALVIHIEPIEHVEARHGPQTGQKMAKATIIVCDPSTTSFKLVLWRDKTRWLDEIRAGDAVLVTDVSLREFRNKVGGNTTNSSTACRLDGSVLERYSGHPGIEETLRILATKRRQLGLQLLHDVDINEPSFYTSMVPLSLALNNGDQGQHVEDEDAVGDGSTADTTPLLAIVSPILQSRKMRSKAVFDPDSDLPSPSPSSQHVTTTSFASSLPGAPKHHSPALQQQQQQQQQQSTSVRDNFLVQATAQTNKTFLSVHSKAAVNHSRQSAATGSRVQGRVSYTMLQKASHPSLGWYVGIVLKEGRLLRIETGPQLWIDDIRVDAIFEFYGRYSKSLGSNDLRFVVDSSSRPPLLLPPHGDGFDTPAINTPPLELSSTSFSSIQALRAARFSGDAVIDAYIHSIDMSLPPSSSSSLLTADEASMDHFIQCICITCESPATSDPTNSTLFHCARCRDAETATRHHRQTSGDSCSGNHSELQWSYPPFHVVLADQPRPCLPPAPKQCPHGHRHSPSTCDCASCTIAESNTLRVFCSYGRGDELFVSVPARRWKHEYQQQQKQQQQQQICSQQVKNGVVHDRWRRLLHLLTAPSPPSQGNKVAPADKIRFYLRVLHHSGSTSIEPTSASYIPSLEPATDDATAKTGTHRNAAVVAKAIKIQPFF